LSSDVVALHGCNLVGWDPSSREWFCQIRFARVGKKLQRAESHGPKKNKKTVDGFDMPGPPSPHFLEKLHANNDDEDFGSQ
jgi:hypothetical protein